MSKNLIYKSKSATKNSKDFVDSFWMLHNVGDTVEDLIVFPNGLYDLALRQDSDKNLSIYLLGLETQFKGAQLAPGESVFAISFKPLAMEYILKKNVSHLINDGVALPNDFWDLKSEDLRDFSLFCRKASEKIGKLLPIEIDRRKKTLFKLITQSNGNLNIAELPQQVHLSSRQLNRYFKDQFGLTLKKYCTILRFSKALIAVKDGKLSPGLNYTDQSHFIKEIKKFTGFSPKELYKNKEDRFIQVSILKEEIGQ